MENKWKEIKVEGIAKIERCVAEFDVWELNKSPWGKFKVKIFESNKRGKGNFTGYTNLLIKDKSGSFEGGVGFGDTIEDALEDTIKYFLSMLNERDGLSENDFDVADHYDF